MIPRGLVNAVVGSPLTPRRLRRLVLRAYGLQIETSGIMERCFWGGSDIFIGPFTTVNVGCVFDNSSRIAIGSRVWIGMEVMFTTSTHTIGDRLQRAGPVDAKPVTIEDGCWIGSRATILPGVTVGAGTIIGAGALVVTDCEPDAVYAGVPARKIRSLEP